MKNPFNSTLAAFRVTREGAEDIITIAYSRNGSAYAFHGYSDDVLAKAGGYGYDKLGTVLAEAVEKLTGAELPNGGAGVGVITDASAELDITITRLI